MKPLGGIAALAEHIVAGASVIVHSGCGEPLALTAALAEQYRQLHDVSLVMMMPMGQAPYAAADKRGHIDVTTFFPGRGLRRAMNDGSARLHRAPLSRLPGLFTDKIVPADVLLLQLSVPDAAGRMSLGVSVDYMPAVLAQRPLVIAAINPSYPRTLGDSFVTAAQVDYFIEGAAPVQTVKPAAGDDPIERRIANHVADLIRDGDVLQVGIGSLSELILARLMHCRDLGFHSGIITDAVVPLMAAGVITNRRKPAFRDLSVVTMAAGTQAFYDYLDNNRAISFQPCSVTHDVALLSMITGLTAVNSVLEVDLSGAANAEIVDGRRISAPGGLPDFASGATAAPSGRSIVTLRSTSKDGSVSRIRAALDESQPATLPPGRIDYLVTEYGVARLSGLRGGDLAKAIAAVAHPDFRRDLTGTSTL